MGMPSAGSVGRPPLGGVEFCRLSLCRHAVVWVMPVVVGAHHLYHLWEGMGDSPTGRPNGGRYLQTLGKCLPPLRCYPAWGWSSSIYPIPQTRTHFYPSCGVSCPPSASPSFTPMLYSPLPYLPSLPTFPPSPPPYIKSLLPYNPPFILSPITRSHTTPCYPLPPLSHPTPSMQSR